MTCLDFVGRRHAGPVPRDVVAAIAGALQAYLAAEPVAGAADPVIPWALAGRREEILGIRAEAPADLIRGQAEKNTSLF